MTATEAGQAAAPARNASNDSSSNLGGTLAGVGLLTLVGGAAVVLTRRRRPTS